MAEFNLTYWFIFSIVILGIFAIMGNSGETSISNIENEFAIMNCPFPLYSGRDFLNGTIIYETSSSGTFYECYKDPLSQFPTTIAYYDHNYNATAFSTIPTGWLGYTGDWLTTLSHKARSVGAIATFVLTPINFDFLGYTIADIGGIGLLFLIILYAVCYLGIGIFLYKSALPTVAIH